MPGGNVALFGPDQPRVKAGPPIGKAVAKGKVVGRDTPSSQPLAPPLTAGGIVLLWAGTRPYDS